MTQRLLQNFAGSRATIVATRSDSIAVLEAMLGRLGLKVDCPPVQEGRPFDVAAMQPGRDILFVDGDLVGVIDPAQPRLALIPVIGLVGSEAPSRLRTLMILGATAFIRKPIHGAAVYTALYLGINQYLQRNELRAQLEEHQSRRNRRRVIVKAIVTMMRRNGIDDDEAYVVLRQESMRARLCLEDYCEEYIKLPADVASSNEHEGDYLSVG